MEAWMKVFIGTIWVSWAMGGAFAAFVVSCLLYGFGLGKWWILSLASFAVTFVYYQLSRSADWLGVMVHVFMAFHAAWMVPLLIGVLRNIWRKFAGSISFSE